MRNRTFMMPAAGLLALTLGLAACGGGGAQPPVIGSQPQVQSVLTGATATFSVAATGPGLSYQWQRDGVDITGATAATYTTAPATWKDSGAAYRVVVSNADGKVTSDAATLSLALSPDQRAYESFYLGAANPVYVVRWNLNSAGAFTAGNYATSDFSFLPASPLTAGPQESALSAPVNLTSTLPLGGPSVGRYLKNGKILVVPASQVTSRNSYVGSAVQVETLADDNKTVAYTQLRTGYTVVPLSGVLAGSTDDFAHYFNSFFSNPAVLQAGKTYLPGAAYIKYMATNAGDRYDVFDCQSVTTGAAPSPCLSGTTLAAAMAAGRTSTSDGKTYVQADGTTSTVDGVPVWVAKTPRPQSATISTTVQYRTYFELNGNVYTGVLVRDGTALGGSYYVSNPAGATVLDRLTFVPFQVRLNKAARDSLAAAMAI